jgi:hypothetical protein
LGKIDPERQVRMNEAVGLEVPVARIVAVDQSVDLRQVFVLADAPRRSGRRQSRQALVDACNPVLRIRMGRKPARDGTLAGHVRRLLQDREDFDHLAHVVALLERVAVAEVVGLAFRIPAVAQKEQLQAAGGQVAELRDRRTQHRADAESQLGELRPAHHGHRVARGHVPDLVAEHAHQLRLIAQQRQEPTGNEDVSARRGKSVGGRVINHAERPGELRPLRGLRKLGAETVHIGLQGSILDEPELLLGLRGHFAPDLDFLALRDQCQLAIPRHGIGRARGE